MAATCSGSGIRMGLDRESVLAVALRTDTYAAFVSGLYDLRAQQASKTLSGEKTPDYCRKMPILHRLFPLARFLHVIRDGRDTALSTLRWASKGKGPGRWDLWQKDPVGCCALWWRWQVGASFFRPEEMAAFPELTGGAIYFYG